MKTLAELTDAYNDVADMIKEEIRCAVEDEARKQMALHGATDMTMYFSPGEDEDTLGYLVLDVDSDCAPGEIESHFFGWLALITIGLGLAGISLHLTAESAEWTDAPDESDIKRTSRSN